MIKAAQRAKGLFRLILCVSSRESRVGIQDRNLKELKQRPWRNAVFVFVSRACSVSYLSPLIQVLLSRSGIAHTGLGLFKSTGNQ